MIKSPNYHKVDKLNKAEARDYQDYLTLFKEWILLNLKLDNVNIKWYTKKQIEDVLYDAFKIHKETEKANTELFQKIYFILKQTINHKSYQKLKNEEIIRNVLEQSKMEFNTPENVTEELILIFTELNKKTEIITRLDLMSVKWLKREDIEDVLYKEVWLSKSSWNKEKLLKAINFIYQKAISKMPANFYLKIPEEYKKKNWKSIDEFIDFILSTSSDKREWYLRLVDCAILKTMDWYDEIFDNPLVSELNQKLDNVIKKIKNIPWMTILSEKDWDIEFSYNSKDWSNPRHVKWRISYRTKEGAKILMKILYNRKYTRLDFFSDLIGFMVEVDNQEMGEKAITLFNRELFCDDSKLNDKWFLSEKFKEKCWIKLWNQWKKVSTSDSFVNASLTWSFLSWSLKWFNDDKNHNNQIPPIEVQFVYVWNKNESWFSKHEIYDSKKLLWVISRLIWYLTLDDIKLIINEVALKSWLPEEWILHHLMVPKSKKDKSYLMKMDIPGTQGYYFTTREVHNKFLENFYNSWIEYKHLQEEDFQDIWKKYLDIK
ncbi:MAG: hypothetical protein ACD_4C00125G0006 [uncultured bacterium (gcode 4)]|uniref:Uncharacterized protein n=1 Tax=uncultured bacterium (gcode 4) TaxID=1234023 RepID=K2FVB2_9BACT|nr:MAG: hypothetical protein ACD_4C00125G0006 [uncultured bacterium (gcode 4)]